MARWYAAGAILHLQPALQTRLAQEGCEGDSLLLAL